MNVADIRLLFEYHFSANRRLWDESVMALTDEQFLCPLPYSIGSIRNQIVHLAEVDESWLSNLQGHGFIGGMGTTDYPTRQAVRQKWDEVEAKVRDYLAKLTDDEANRWVDDKEQIWHGLVEMVMHGVDHRAQILAMLHSFGAPTFQQDFIMHIWGQRG